MHIFLDVYYIYCHNYFKESWDKSTLIGEKNVKWEITHIDTREWSRCLLCRDQWHWGVSWGLHLMPPMTTKHHDNPQFKMRLPSVYVCLTSGRLRNENCGVNAYYTCQRLATTGTEPPPTAPPIPTTEMPQGECPHGFRGVGKLLNLTAHRQQSWRRTTMSIRPSSSFYY